MAVERLLEGDRAQRIRLDRGPLDRHKMTIKLAKFAIWTVMGLWLGLTFAGYFVPIRELVSDLASGHPLSSTVAILAILTGISLFDFGWFREQFCCYLCPYARFQGAMLDSHSFIVGYDSKRGEPRGKAKESGKGDCVDCTMCVQVCPTGIDIRKGLQLEYITCAACVDVMDKLERPRGLIRYTSLEELEGRKPKLVRPRVLVYGVLLTVLGSIFGGLLWNRSPIGLDAVRQAPGGLENFTRNPDGRISNPYRVHAVNRTREPLEVKLSLEGFPGAEFVTPVNPYRLEGGRGGYFDRPGTARARRSQGRPGVFAASRFRVCARGTGRRVSCSPEPASISRALKASRSWMLMWPLDKVTRPCFSKSLG